MKFSKFVVCLTTVAKRKDGEKIAKYLVKKKLVACVSLIPSVVSHYRWKKKICRDREIILLLKTALKKVPSLEKALKKIHPYELPEFIVLPILKGSTRYFQWLEEGIKD